MDKKYDIVIKSPPATNFKREAAKIKRGTNAPGREIVVSITKIQSCKYKIVVCNIPKRHELLYQNGLIHFSEMRNV